MLSNSFLQIHELHRRLVGSTGILLQIHELYMNAGAVGAKHC
jgi:hypothetical protein